MVLDKLIQIHEANQRLEEINDMKGDLPSLLYDQELEFNDLEKNQEESELMVKDLSKNLNKHQIDLTSFNTKLEKYNDQLLKVKNNKEYDAVLLEIDHLKSEILNINSEISNINSQIENAESIIEKNKPLMDELSDKISINKDELKEKMLETEKEEQLLNKNKEKLISQISDDMIYKTYSKLYDKYGQGMSQILRKSCSHCYTQLPPQTLVEIEYDKKIITCPSCSVFLYHKNETD